MQAAGGGDGPEAVNQGLHAALNDLKWDADKKTAKLLFLIGDAPPHSYPNDYNWQDESKHAIARGIQINTIGCQGLEGYPSAEGTSVFQQIAKLSDGKFETLAYRQEVAGADGHRLTVVSSGGAYYKLRGAGKADWKAEVAKGAVDKMSVPVARPMFASVAAAPAPAGGAAYYAAAKAMPAALMGSPALSRADSNLDDVMLQAAKTKSPKLSMSNTEDDSIQVDVLRLC